MSKQNDSSLSDKLLNMESIRLDPISHIHKENNQQFVSAIARGLEILRCFTPKNQILGNQDLANLTGLPKPTIARITNTLVVLGYLKNVFNSTKYALDVGVLSLGYASLANLSSSLHAREYMQEMSEYANAPVTMAARDRLNMVYLDIVNSNKQMGMRKPIGYQLPIYSTSLGRACLAAMNVDERNFILQALEKKLGEDWEAAKLSLDEAFEDYHKHGYCLSIGDWHNEVNSVAVPLVHSSQGILVFSCGAPSYQLSVEKVKNEIGPRLIHMVHNIRDGLNNIL